MHVETNHQIYSSEASLGGITIRDAPPEFRRPMFIAMDQPKHGAQRKTVAPMFTRPISTSLPTSSVNVPRNADALPRNATFDWVDRVSIELTTQMLATLFDFPWEDRRKLTRWSDVANAARNTEIIASEDARQAELRECAAYFSKLWNERINAERKMISFR
jgi:cytochrome P450